MYRRLVTPVFELLNSKFVNTRPILAINQCNVTNLQTRPFSSISPIIYKLEQNLPSYQTQQITERFYSTDIKRPKPKCISGAKCLVCRKEREVLCAQKEVVYKAICPYCGAFYIGQTRRALKVRAAEHERDRKKVLNNENPEKRTPFTKHRCAESIGREYLPLSFEILKNDLENEAIRKEIEKDFIEKMDPAINGNIKKRNKKSIH